MSEINMKDEEYRSKLVEALRIRQKRMAMTNEEFFARLKKMGIDFSEERIIEDYKRVKDVQTLDDSYYEQYGEYIDDHQTDEIINSDVFMELMDRIIPEHFNITETGDPYFVEAALENLIYSDPRSVDQSEVEEVFRAMTVLSKTRNVHSLDECFGMYDLNVLLRELIRVCHNRNTAFRNLVREMYECFDDLDPKIFPSVYREAKKNGK